MTDQGMTDQEARDAILREFYEGYREGGLYIIVQINRVAEKLRLDAKQAKRCFDYLSAKGYITALTRGGGYGPTVQLVDEVEQSA